METLDNYWFVGKPGTGKSLGARARWPGLYNKPLNKWWTEYVGQETILLDDFGKEHSCLGAHLKHWADHYPFTAESKGGGMVIRPRRVIVTSNYSVADIWECQSMREAIYRRFKLVTFQEDSITY